MKRSLVAIILLVILVVSVGCQAKVAEGKYVDGTYNGVGEGKYGPINVEVIVDKGNIIEIKALEHSETPGLSDPVFEKMFKAMVEKQTTEVDAISGGTVTSEGITAAVADALKDAVK